MGMNRVILFEIHCRSLDINATVSLFQRPPLRITPPLEADQLIPEKRSERTISPTLLHHAALMNVGETTIAVLNDTAGNATDFEKEVVDLSAHSFHSTHHEDTKEDVIDHQFVPNWRLCADLCICTFRAYKELVSHLATPAEEKFWGSLSNVEVVSRVYQSDAHLVELDCLRTMHANNGLSKKFTLLENVNLTCSERERELMDGLKDMEKERDGGRQTTSEQVALVAELAQAEMDTVVRTLYMSVEYQKSLATPVSLCFTAGWLGGLSLVVDSYRLQVDALMKVSPDIPPSATEDRAGPSTTDDTGDAA
ncbi:hypothetical protein Tco_0831555 [Tanacetum coccineum]